MLGDPVAGGDLVQLGAVLVAAARGQEAEGGAGVERRGQLAREAQPLARALDAAGRGSATAEISDWV